MSNNKKKEFEADFIHSSKFENEKGVPKSEAFFKNGPRFKAVGMTRTDDGSYVAYTVIIEDGQVVEYHLDEPCAKYIAEDQAKVAFVHNFQRAD